jgi:microcystin-dependent protein
MAEPILGEIRLFAGNFAPEGWALCNGQLLQLRQYTALFSLLGTYYGGDGKTTFALPDLRARVPIGAGNGAGLTPRSVGEAGGEAAVSLIVTEMPTHTHLANCSSQQSSNQPEGAYWGSTGRGANAYAATPATNLSPLAAQLTGGSQPHNNMQPYLGMTFIIAMEGDFPQRP